MVSSLVVGDPLSEQTDVSSVISQNERDRVKGWVDEAVEQGGRIVAGGDIDGNGVLVPTVIADAKPEMQVCINEVFGPVVAIQAIDSVDEGLKIANDTAYGLQAAIFTNDISTAFEAVRTLDFGGVLVNEVPTWRADQMPYGGIRDSGNTREGPAYSVARDDRDASGHHRDQPLIHPTPKPQERRIHPHWCNKRWGHSGNRARLSPTRRWASSTARERGPRIACSALSVVAHAAVSMAFTAAGRGEVPRASCAQWGSRSVADLTSTSYGRPRTDRKCTAREA